MSKLSDIELRKLNSLNNQGGFWYITKQNLVFRDLCFMSKILDDWNDRPEENYESFFNNHKILPEYGELGASTAHRATKNCEYLGLIRPSERYSAQNLTPFYFALKDLCNGDFNKLSSYPNIIDKQLERIFIDSSLNSLYTSQIQICPFMFLFKILLLIGDITNSYKITIQEFKLFVATAQTWKDYFAVVESILRYRSDADYRNASDANLSKVSDVRYNILAQNHSQLEVTSTEIAIKEGSEKNIRRKVAEYELNDAIQSAEDIFSADLVLSPLTQTENSSYAPLLTALQTKPFVLLAGISGTGKSQKVQELAFMTCPNGDLRNEGGTTPGNYCLVEVKPNWHDSTDLLGFYSALSGKYELTDFIRFVYKATKHSDVPFFLCLDEMNLAPVEQYFAEFLSVLETRKKVGDSIQTQYLLSKDRFSNCELKIREPKKRNAYNVIDDQPEYDEKPLYSEADAEIICYLKENGLTLPDNLFVIGTVNMDDTTHQFSRKVIDRAFTIEMNGGKMADMFGAESRAALEYREKPVGLYEFKSQFVRAYEVLEDGRFAKYADIIKERIPALLGNSDGTAASDSINGILNNTPFRVSYRVQNELIIYLSTLIERAKFPENIDGLISEAVLAILLEKILPRVQGEQKQLETKKDEKPSNILKDLKSFVERHFKPTEDTPGSLYNQVISKLDEMDRKLDNYYTNFF